MTVQFKRNVKLICDLSIGEEVLLTGFSHELDGGHIIKEIQYAGVYKGENWAGSCESGFLVRIDGYNKWLDSGWVHKLDAQ